MATSGLAVTPGHIFLFLGELKVSDLSYYGHIWVQCPLVLVGVSSHAQGSGFEFLEDFCLSYESARYSRLLVKRHPWGLDDAG